MPYRMWLFLVLIAAVGLSAMSPFDRRDWTLEHVPTAAALVFLVWYEWRRGGRPLSTLAYTCLFLFGMLHVIGAHHLYMRVPYDAWWEALFGTTLSSAIGATRNHYDRFVHGCFGLLVLPAIAELTRRHVTPAFGWTMIVSIAFVGVISKLYELAEWIIGICMSPEAAEAYNGQQGDVFDAQKDMGLAFLGSLVSSALVVWHERRHGSAAGTSTSGVS